MQKTPSRTTFSATDLSTFVECDHRTSLELGVLDGKHARPPQSEIERLRLQLRGNEHEQRVLEQYRASGKQVMAITAAPGRDGQEKAHAETLAAMARGVDVIYQSVLINGDWIGRPDFLARVAGSGTKWAHHYEPVDAKLAQEAKGRAVLQLCAYADQLTTIQGITPRHMHIIPGGLAAEPVHLLTADFMAYYRSLRERYLKFVASDGDAGYPEPVEHCNVCPWWKRCEDRRRTDDHLSLVARISRRHRDRLTTAGIDTVVALGALSPASAIDGIERASLARLQEQASLQIRARSTGRIDHRLLVAADTNVGLEALPMPKPGDLFFDIEGDAFVGGEGLEYLFGLVELGAPEFDWVPRKTPGVPRYIGHWAHDAKTEKEAFEKVIDRIVAGRAEFRELHVFHYGHRESSALKRLSCRHGTREAEVDQLLREHVLVDLYPIVRHGLLAGIEHYTLKQLEQLHGFTRKGDLREASRAMATYGLWLDAHDPRVDVAHLESVIQAYNEDDCLSTWRLRDWLEARRVDFEKIVQRPLTRPGGSDKAPSEDTAQKNADTAKLVDRLLAGLPDDSSADDDHQRSRRLLAGLLEWHWREAKSGWWEYFRALELPAEDRLDDRTVLDGLVYQGEVGTVDRSIVHAYGFPEQEHAIRSSTKARPIDPDTKKSAGTVVEVGATYIHLKREKPSLKKPSVPHPRSLTNGAPVDTKAQAQSLYALGTSFLAGQPQPPFLAALNLLTRTPPGASTPQGGLIAPAESIEDALTRLTSGPEGTVVPIQGPPGSGKTYQAAQLIRRLVAAGKRVGVTANSHSVIIGVLKREKALGGSSPVRSIHLCDETADDGEPGALELSKDKPKTRQRLADGDVNVVGGTPWTWAAEPFIGSVDVLVIDEAGQVSLANALAVARAAKTLVLLGDPAQLDQPQKGVHPPGADVSALEHLLGEDHLTIPADRGIFLPETRRLHPRICNFISAVFYEGRLRPSEGLGLEKQRIDGPGIFLGAGLRFVPVAHRGNTNLSAEEVAVVATLVDQLISPESRATYTDNKGAQRPITGADVLVVAPYNAQVAALRRVLPESVLVGTVDKFQGKEAPVVIYSMASSTAEDAPKGLEFLCSLNRLNVAISRAQAIAVLVASPDLPRTPCKTPRQMRLANALCTYIEMAGTS
jgi:predicted RecB family nuclease